MVGQTGPASGESLAVVKEIRAALRDLEASNEELVALNNKLVSLKSELVASLKGARETGQSMSQPLRSDWIATSSSNG